MRGRLVASDEHETAILQQEDGMKLPTPGASALEMKCTANP